MPDPRQQLREIAHVLIAEEIEYKELTNAIRELEILFHSCANFDPNNDSNREDIYTNEGKALGATWAAACTNEIARTKMFVKGIYEAINDVLKKKESVHILYAGSGPFATLLTPLTSLFSSKQLRITALEINQLSIKYLKKTIEALDITDYFCDIIECDATSYVLESKNFDILLSETMLKALCREPQVAIILNLLPQLNKDIIMIPENIIVDASLRNWNQEQKYLFSCGGENDNGRRKVDEVMEFNATSALEIVTKSAGNNGSFVFPEKVVSLPKTIEQGYDELYLGTTIFTYSSNKLSGNDCSLTLPYKVMRINSPKQKICFKYATGKNPGFNFKILN